jgi:hypothetical protein
MPLPIPFALLLAGLLLSPPGAAQGFRCPLFQSGFEPDGGGSSGRDCSARINDTGAERCINPAGAQVDCPHLLLPGQDGESGRDRLAANGQLRKRGFGPAGYDFSKLDAQGNELPVRAIRWSCLRDNRSGLIWEVKLDDPGSPRHYTHRFTWFDPTAGQDGGPLGSPGDPLSCNQTLGNQGCNTHALVQAVNAGQLCGRSDWRLPEQDELLGIVDFGSLPPRPIPGVLERISDLAGEQYKVRRSNLTLSHTINVRFYAVPTIASPHAQPDRVLLVAGRP